MQRLGQNGTASGARTLLPGSVAHGNTAVANQRIAVSGRGHGRSGVYVAYETGYPFALGVNVLRLGTRKTVRLASTSTADQFAGATVTADPAGGLWVAWYTGVLGHSGPVASLTASAAGGRADPRPRSRTMREVIPSPDAGTRRPAGFARDERGK